MGRHAPEQEYEIYFCDSQAVVKEHTKQILLQSLDNTAVFDTIDYFAPIPGPFGATGNAVTGYEPVFSTGTNSGIPYFDGQLAIITTDNRAVYNTTTITNTDNTPSGKFSLISAGYAGSLLSLYSIVPGGTFSGSTVPTGYNTINNKKFILPGVNTSYATLTGSISGTTLSGIIYGLEKIENGKYLVLKKPFSTVSGYDPISIDIISTTGDVTVETTSDVPDTLGSGLFFTNLKQCSIAKDTSYTGDVSRFLLGYSPTSGVGSGTLAARLIEVSGYNVTYGDPVVIRSDIPASGNSTSSGNRGINVVYHNKENAFVIGTNIITGVSSSTKFVSGELIACNPPSGLVLSGYFGSAVSALDSTTGQVGRVYPCVLASHTGTTDYGFVNGIKGPDPGQGALHYQTYSVSGNTITTGDVLSGSFSNANYYNIADLPGGAPATVADFIFKDTLAYSDRSLLKGIMYVSGTSSTFLSGYYLDVAHSLTTSVSIISQEPRGLFRIGDFQLSGNPYSGELFSNFYLNSFSGISDGSTSTGLIDVLEIRLDTFARNSGVFSPTVDLPRTTCVLSSGVKRNTNRCGLTTELWNIVSGGAASSSYRLLDVVDVEGTYPDYDKIVFLTYSGSLSTDRSVLTLGTFSFSSGLNSPGYNVSFVTGYLTTPNMIITSGVYNTSTYYNWIERNLDQYLIGKVVNPDSKIVDGAASLTTGSYKEQVLVKVPKSKSYQRKLLREALSSFEIIYPVNVLA